VEDGALSCFWFPSFVLAKKLQDGDAIQKWKAKSWMGVFIGHSLQHSSNVPVVYNPRTTHISPQFHVIFDDQFTTVSNSALSLPADFYTKLFNTAKWAYEDNYTDTSDLYVYDNTHLQPPLSLKSNLSIGSQPVLPPNQPQTRPNPESHPASIPTASHPAPTPESHPAPIPPESHPAGHPASLLSESYGAHLPTVSHDDQFVGEC
jgi:hypothetical protein